MARARIRGQGRSATALRELNRRMKAAGRVDLARNMRREIKAAGDPVVGEIRAAVTKVQVTVTHVGRSKIEPRRRTKPNPERTGLRARVAAATGLSQTQRGIRFRVSADRVDKEYGVTLPRYLDASLGYRWQRWRSPIFWPGPIGTAPPDRVKQQLGQPYFFGTIKRREPVFRAAVDKAAQDALREMLG